jgi:pectinesterase
MLSFYMSRSRRLTRHVGCAAAIAIAGAASSPMVGAQRTTPASPRVSVRVENTLPVERRDETIAIAWGDVRAVLPTVQAERVRVIDAATEREVVTQVLDANGDGQADSLLFQASFWPSESRVFLVDAMAPAAAKPRVHARYDVPRDDMAWENDRIAFRIYGEGLWKTPDSLVSNGIDVWVKRTRELVLEKWYGKGHDEYHTDRGEGADFFNVGATLGAGGTAVWQDGKLHRFSNFKTHKIVADGPIRAIFELQYPPIDVGGLHVAETKRIIIDAGSNLYRSESVFRADGATEIPYAIGLVKRKGMIGSTSKAQAWGWLSAWGPMDVKQGEGGHGELGTAVLLDRQRVADWKESDDHYFAVSSAKPGQPVVHYIGAAWTASGDFPDVRVWWDYLTKSAQRFATPVKVTVTAAQATAAR